MAFVCVLLLGQITKKLFLGTLREAEIEVLREFPWFAEDLNRFSCGLQRMYEKTWFSIIDTCLAMTIFREEFSVRFRCFFVCLYVCFGKISVTGSSFFSRFCSSSRYSTGWANFESNTWVVDIFFVFLLLQHFLAQIYQSPTVTRFSQVRVLALLASLLVVDCLFLVATIHQSLEKGPSILLLFAFEVCYLL